MTVKPRFLWLRSLISDEFPAQAYEALYQSVAHATPFNHLSWLRGAEGARQAGQTLHILLAWEGERLLLCLPLLYCREHWLTLPMRIVRHLGHPLTDRLVPLVDPDAAAALMPAALHEIRRRLPHAMIQLDEITVQAARCTGLETWGREVWRWDSRISCRVPEHRISEDDRQETPRDLRSRLRRARKHCAAIGAEVVRICPGEHDIDLLLAEIRQVEQASWKGEQGVGIFSGAHRDTWLHTALRGLAADGRLRLALLKHEGRCISYRLGLLERGRLYDYNIAFLPEYAHLGSGRLLLNEWILWGLDEGWQWVDASRVRLHQSNHQLHERMTGQVEHCRWRFYSRRPSGLLLGLVDRLWQARLKPWLQQWRASRTQTVQKPSPKPSQASTQSPIQSSTQETDL